MKNPMTIAKANDSIEIIINKMKKHRIESIFVINEEKKLLGLLRKDKINGSIKNERIVDLVDLNFTKVDKDISIEELFIPLANSNEPIAVISEGEMLLGIIVRSDIIKVLAERRDFNE